MSAVQEVSDANFEDIVLNADKPVLVDFWAPWCGPCQMITPFVERLASDFAGDLVVAKMNVDENQKIPAQLNIRSIPYLIVFKNGEIFKEVVGAPDPQSFVEMLESSLDPKS